MNVEQPVDADRPGGRRRHDRARTAPSASPACTPCDDLLGGELALLEVLLEQRVVGLGDGLHQLLAERLGLAPRCPPATRPRCRSGRRRTGSALRTAGRRRPRKSCSSPIGSWIGATWVPNACTSSSSVRSNEARSRSSLLIDDGAGQARLGGQLPDDLGLDLDAVDGRDHEQARVRGPQRAPDVADEVGVPGSVQEVDLDAAPTRPAPWTARR